MDLDDEEDRFLEEIESVIAGTAGRGREGRCRFPARSAVGGRDDVCWDESTCSYERNKARAGELRQEQQGAGEPESGGVHGGLECIGHPRCNAL